MKTRIKLTLLAIVSIFSMVIKAQADSSTRTAEVSDKCKENNSVFYEFAKNKSYADAAAPWLELYTTCPEYSKNIYKYGAKILNWQIKQEPDAAKKQVLVNRLMSVYDDRIKYFGDDSYIPTPRILGLKAIDYYKLPTPKDKLKKEAYKWMGQAVDGLGNKTDAAFLQYYIILSVNIFNKEPAHLDKLVKDYVKVNDILLVNVSDSTSKYAKSYEQVKDANNQYIAKSKALSVEVLDKIYLTGVEENKLDLAYLSSVISLYKAVGGDESQVYFSASAYAHKIQPTEESAVGCANMSMNKKDYESCVAYLEDATKLSNSDANKASYQMNIANMYYNLKNKPKAREHARKSLEYNSQQGKPYILIGNLYASSTGIYSDAVLNKTIYYAAVDKYIKAKAIDSSVVEEANEKINKYSSYFPEDNEIFMHPDLEKGKSYTVGGWIGETTMCR